MKVEVSVNINAPATTVWAVITDFDNAADNIAGIEKVEVLNRPESGLVGFKWRETRKMYGKEATEVMWITDAEPESYYRTRAESHGSIYLSELRVAQVDGTTRLKQTFEGQPVTIAAKLVSGLMGWMMKSGIKKACEQDLNDIKLVAESRN